MDLTSWLNQTVTYATKSGVSSFGDATFGTSASLAARVEAKRKIIPQTDGTSTESSHVIYTATKIAIGARVWLPGDTAATAAHARRVVDAREHPNKWNSQVLYEAYV